MSALEKPVYHFRDFALEPAERRLSQAGRPIALTPKVFDTLVLLVERAGHVVSKDELMQRLWPRGYVDESNLTKHIWLIRRALGDREDESRLIETVPKVGYRFVAPVNSAGDASAASQTSGDEPPADAGEPSAAAAPAIAAVRRPRWIFAALAGALIVVLLVGWRLLEFQKVQSRDIRQGREV